MIRNMVFDIGNVLMDFRWKEYMRSLFGENDLKLINDRYGHKRGDSYLLGVVEMIQDCFPGCQVYRIGGD